MAKRKGTPWGPSNPLWRWQHRKTNKTVTRHKTSEGNKMPRKRRYFRRGKSYRRHKDHRIPIIPTVAIASTFFTPCPSGNSIFGDIQEGNLYKLAYDAREKFAGIDNEGKFRFEWLIGTYGPVVVGALVSKFAGKFVNPSLSKIPFIGKYVRL